MLEGNLVQIMAFII